MKRTIMAGPFGLFFFKFDDRCPVLGEKAVKT